MYQFWRNNKNVVLVAVSLFFISATSLLFFLSDEDLSTDLKADVINAHETESGHDGEEINLENFPELGEGPIIALGLDGIIENATYEYEKITDYHIEEIQGELYFSLVHPDDLSGLLAAYSKVLTSEEPESIVGPFRIKNANGDYQIHMASMQPLVQEGNLVGVALSSLDISDSLDLDLESNEHDDEEAGEAGYVQVSHNDEQNRGEHEEIYEEAELEAVENEVMGNDEYQEEEIENPDYNNSVNTNDKETDEESSSIKSETIASEENYESNQQEEVEDNQDSTVGNYIVKEETFEEEQVPSILIAEPKIDKKSEEKKEDKKSEKKKEKKKEPKPEKKSEPKIEKKKESESRGKSDHKKSDKRLVVKR